MGRNNRFHCLESEGMLDGIAYKRRKPVRGNETEGEVRVSLPGKEFLPKQACLVGKISFEGNGTEGKVGVPLPGNVFLPKWACLVSKISFE